jgi:tRNA/tmRNA/rRNA uracil-C5-methylase (TrmA/RlmC/RlmD family)
MQPFAEHFASVIRATPSSPRLLSKGECQSPDGKICRLCYAAQLDYKSEAVLKNEALQRFWKTLRLPVILDPLVLSPLGRNYRSTTKRRVFPFRDSVRLGLISPNEKGELKPISVVQCAIEPISHSMIYNQIQESIVKPYAKRLARALNYVVIKGNYSEQTVIFNVKDISHDELHAANTLSKSLTKKNKSIVGLYLYEDSTSPQYYLGSKNKNRQPQFKKLFGKPDIFQRIAGRSFLYSPLSFSQINQSFVEKMIQTAERMLKPTAECMLFDLYCGYGLFALCLSDKVKNVVAADVSPSSIDSAIANAKRQNVRNARFLRTDIKAETIERITANATHKDVVLLDPPRNGTEAGVIECIAAKQPRRVVHIFCEIDLIAKELKRWEKSGYKPTHAIPLDLFPGTATVETMLLLEPK